VVAGAGIRDLDKRVEHSAPRQRPPAAVDRLSLRQQVGQLLVTSFPGATAPDYVRRRLRDAEGAGVILFGENTATREGLTRLTRSLQGYSRGSALVAVDQEGGSLRNVPYAGPEQGQASQADPRAAARDAGRGLRRLGVNVTLTPVADTDFAGRSFRDPVNGTREAVAGYHGSGVAATAKHFPGLGGAGKNTDDAAVRIGGRPDLAPFRAAIDGGVPLVMVSHANYPELDPTRIASQSPAILRLLRGRLEFGGVAITDSIEAEAVIGRQPVEVGAERAVAAGCDLVLMTGSGSPKLVYPRLLATARRSPAFRRRVRESAARVIALKLRLGLRAPR
jgi:beta-N-acetylhexosaminidase